MERHSPKLDSGGRDSISCPILESSYDTLAHGATWNWGAELGTSQCKNWSSRPADFFPILSTPLRPWRPQAHSFSLTDTMCLWPTVAFCLTREEEGWVLFRQRKQHHPLFPPKKYTIAGSNQISSFCAWTSKYTSYLSPFHSNRGSHPIALKA